MKHFLRYHFLSNKEQLKFFYFILIAALLIFGFLANKSKNAFFHLVPFNNQIIDTQIDKGTYKSNQSAVKVDYKSDRT